MLFFIFMENAALILNFDYKAGRDALLFFTANAEIFLFWKKTEQKFYNGILKRDFGGHSGSVGPAFSS